MLPNLQHLSLLRLGLSLSLEPLYEAVVVVAVFVQGTIACYSQVLPDGRHKRPRADDLFGSEQGRGAVS